MGPILTLLALPALQPLFRYGLTASFDGRTHLLRLAALARSVADGISLPRWLPAMQLGYGYPVFNFYPPGAYYLALVPNFFGVTLYWAYALSFVLALLLAGAGATMLARDLLKGNSPPSSLALPLWPALVAGVAYMYAPYLLVNIYIRGSLPEVVAQALLPWVLWSSRRVLTQPRPVGYVLLAATFLGSLALTHSLTLLFTVPYLLTYLCVIWWNRGRSCASLLWVILALTAAAGVSAFFWLPMIGDRGYLSEAGYVIARTGWLPDNVWKWSNFLDRQVIYGYDFARPVQLGLVQIVLAIGGFLWARRHNGEWLFFALSAVLAMVAIGAWSLPIWQSSEVLVAVQFPWRLLSLVSLSLAMLTVGWLMRLPAGWPQWLAIGLVTLALIGAQRPRLGEMDFYSPASVRLDAPLLAQAEVEKGVLTEDPASSVQEFRPQWADTDLILDTVPLRAAPVDINGLQVSPLALAMQVNVPTTTTLRFQDFYFPGWRITAKDDKPLTPYPSTDLGLLTVDLPPGAYTVNKAWHDPPFAGFGAGLSLLTLTLVAGVCLVNRRYRWFALLPSLFLVTGVTTWIQTPVMTAVTRPTTPLAAAGLRLLGFYVEPVKPGQMLLYSYWYVTASPPPDLQFRWQLRDTTGAVVQDYVRRPYFNTMSAANWPPGTIVDDAVQLALPEGEANGVYQIAAGLILDDATAFRSPVVIGTLKTEQASANPPQPSQVVDAKLGNSIQLVGADYAINNDWSLPTTTAPRYVRPGQTLSVRLYWRTEQSLTQDLHGFVHLVDAQGNVIAQQDQAPGLDFQPSVLWLPGNTVVDEYDLSIPLAATSTVLWPLVGLYDIATQARLPTVAADSVAGDAIRLAPVKLVGEPQVAVAQERAIRFGELADLAGFTVETPAQGLWPGATLTVTLAFRTLTPTTHDLTRFVHIYSPSLGLAGQVDSVPQAGNNPTWSWTPSEVIVDRVVVTIGAPAKAGDYTVGVGFYDPAANGQRLPAVDQAGNVLPDNIATLTELTIEARPTP